MGERDRRTRGTTAAAIATSDGDRQEASPLGPAWLDRLMPNATLGDSGTVTTDAEVVPDAQRADLFYDPDPTRDADRAKLGLLGLLVATPCLLEFFSSAPSIEDVRGCVRKHLVF